MHKAAGSLPITMSGTEFNFLLNSVENALRSSSTPFLPCLLFCIQF